MKKRQRGVAIVEFALVLPFLLVLTFITTEYGRAIWQYNTLTKSVRDAARYLSMQTPETKITQARNLMIYGNLSGTGTPLAPGLTASHVPDPTWQDITGTPVNGSATPMKTVTVRISGYQFKSVFVTAFGIPFGTVTFSDITATMRNV